MKKFGLAIALGALMLLSAQSALAQYPPTTAAPTQTIVEGTLTPGGTVVFTSCGYIPNSSVTLALNGVAIGTDTVEGDGCVRQTVSLATTGTGAGRSVIAAIGARTLLAQQGSASVIIDGRTFSARVGSNTLVVTGNRSGDGAQRTVSHVFTIAAGAAGGTGGLARTGGMIATWSFLGLMLIGAGFAVVTANRRRQQAS